MSGVRHQILFAQSYIYIRNKDNGASATWNAWKRVALSDIS